MDVFIVLLLYYKLHENDHYKQSHFENKGQKLNICVKRMRDLLFYIILYHNILSQSIKRNTRNTWNYFAELTNGYLTKS